MPLVNEERIRDIEERLGSGVGALLQEAQDEAFRSERNIGRGNAGGVGGVSTVSEDYNVILDDRVLRVDTTSSDVAVTLPSYKTFPWGEVLEVKNIAAANKIVVTPLGSETIDGAALLNITTGAVARLRRGEDEWEQY